MSTVPHSQKHRYICILKHKHKHSSTDSHRPADRQTVTKQEVQKYPHSHVHTYIPSYINVQSSALFCLKIISLTLNINPWVPQVHKDTISFFKDQILL